ncbi:MAG: molecular chaperone HtpG [Candidatus Cloacimonetes bacterium]|nr:molecular chaperone HtpG [Candidatus Cloacimonadota bacterium]
MSEAKKGNLSIHTENIFPIIKKWLYSEQDIFVRELISNATDASNKRKVLDTNIKDEDLEIEIKIDKNKKTISIIDNGIGMTQEEIEKYINQIAFSGAEDFIGKYKDKQAAIIGHFGLGFYSSFMVSDKVTIDSLSYTEGAEPTFWECDGSVEYSTKKGKRKNVGTTVTLHLNTESESYLESHKIKELLEKYCSFMPFPIKFEKDLVNVKEALWNKKPIDVTEDEYKEFYKKIFHDYQDPIFWIHLNTDYPFTLKGILYFPKMRQDIELLKGKVKLYCNNVFVADNLKEFIPEFMTMLRGGIDVPDIPLNVSRSFLQNDKQVQQIRKHIVKKISDQFISTFKEDRKKYETYWEDIKNVIKYGMLTEEEFGETMRDFVIFKNTKGDFMTITEYIESVSERQDKEDKKTKIYYGVSENTQVSLLNLIKEQNIEVIFCESPLDTHLMQSLEMKNPDISFVRIDSEINDLLIDNEKVELLDQDNKTFNQNLEEKIQNLLNDDKIKIEIKSLKSNALPGMVIFNEFMRRFSEMSALQTGGTESFLRDHTFVLNAENPTVKKIYDLSLAGKTDEAKTLITYIHDLAMLEQKRFTGEELKSFVENANKVLKLVHG